MAVGANPTFLDLSFPAIKVLKLLRICFFTFTHTFVVSFPSCFSLSVVNVNSSSFTGEKPTCLFCLVLHAVEFWQHE